MTGLNYIVTGVVKQTVAGRSLTHSVLHLCVETILLDCHTPPIDTTSIKGTQPNPPRKLLSTEIAYMELQICK